MKSSEITKIIEESLKKEVKETIMKNKEVYHIMCDGEPVDSFETKEIAMRHLDMYKKKHPEKQFIIEKKSYDSSHDMIEKLDNMGEKLENKDTQNMEKKKVKSFAEAVLHAKEKGLKEFKMNGKIHDVDECWKKLEEEEEAHEGWDSMEENVDMDEQNAFVLAANDAKEKGKDEFEFPEGSGKMHKVSLKKTIDVDEQEHDEDGDEIHLIWKKYSDKAIEENDPSTYSDRYQFADNVIKDIVSDAIKNGDISEEDEYKFIDELKETYGEDILYMFRSDSEDIDENKGMCNECGGMINEEGMCSECGAMYEHAEDGDPQFHRIGKKTLKLKESEFIALITKMVNEVKENDGKVKTQKTKKTSVKEAIPGLEVTKKAQALSKKDNTSNMSDVEKKLKDYSTFDGNDNPKFPHQIGGEKKAFSPSQQQADEIADERGSIMTDYKFDYEPSESYKERQEMALKGDPKMGNAQYEEGNTIKTKTGENLLKSAERKKEKLKKETQVSWGHRGLEPLRVKNVNESKDKSKNLINEDVERMKNIFNYNKKTQ